MDTSSAVAGMPGVETALAAGAAPGARQETNGQAAAPTAAATPAAARESATVNTTGDTAPAAASYVSHAAGHFLASKAGMAGVDKAYVARVVEEASAGSKYYENAKQREQALMEKIEVMKKAVAATPAADLARFEAQMDAWAAKAEAERCFTRVCVVVDMDAFFAAVEERDDASLKGKPFAVGGMGMISTASYEARKFGVRSAMPGFIGIKLCPQLRFVRPDFKKYEQASEEARVVFRQYDQGIHAGSLDEAYLNLTKHCIAHDLIADVDTATGNLTRAPTNEEQARIAAVVAEMRRKVVDATRGLTCSAGIGPNFMLAKIASNDRKPNGQTLVAFDRERVLAFLRDRNVRDIPGVGKVTEKILTELGIKTIGDILGKRAIVRAAFNERMSQWLQKCALGVSEADVHGFGDTGGDTDDEDGVGRKSISHERTFRDCDQRDVLLRKCEELSGMVAEEMQNEEIVGRTVSIRLKLHTFEVRQRSHTLPRVTNDAATIAAAAKALLLSELPVRLRLMGVRMSALAPVHATERKGAMDKFVRRSPPVADDAHVDPSAAHSGSPKRSLAQVDARRLSSEWATLEAARPRKRGIAEYFASRTVYNATASLAPADIVILDEDDEDEHRALTAHAAFVERTEQEAEPAGPLRPAGAQSVPSDASALQVQPASTDITDKPAATDARFPEIVDLADSSGDERATTNPAALQSKGRTSKNAACCPVCHAFVAHCSEHEFAAHVDGCVRKQERKGWSRRPR